MSHTDPNKNRGWNYELAKGKQFPSLIRHSSSVGNIMSFEVYVQMKSSTFNFDTERKLEMVAEMNYQAHQMSWNI